MVWLVTCCLETLFSDLVMVIRVLSRYMPATFVLSLESFYIELLLLDGETRLSGAGRLRPGLVPPSLVLSCEIGRHFQGMLGSQSFVGW